MFTTLWSILYRLRNIDKGQVNFWHGEVDQCLGVT